MKQLLLRCKVFLNLVTHLYTALINLLAARLSPSRAGGSTFYSNLLHLVIFLADINEFDIDRIFPLLLAILKNESNRVIWGHVTIAVTVLILSPCVRPNLDQTLYSFNTSSLLNNSEYRKHVDTILKVELGSNLDIEVLRFYEAFFGEIEGLGTAVAAVFMKCQKGNNPLYNKKLGWRDWPQSGKEKDVLKWFAELVEFFLNAAKEMTSVSKVHWQLLALSDQALQGSIADRKLEVGFVNDPKATQNFICYWSQIFEVGELKSNS